MNHDISFFDRTHISVRNTFGGNYLGNVASLARGVRQLCWVDTTLLLKQILFLSYCMLQGVVAMQRIQALDPERATGKAKRLLDDIQERWGMISNMVRTMAKAPAVLDGYLSFHTALSNGNLPAGLREQIAVAVAEANNCRYCLAAHCAIGKTVGLGEDVLMDSRHATSPDSRVEAVLHFARELVENRGWVTDDDLFRLRRAGYADEEIVEIIANVAINMFTNYFNHVAKTELDFPAVPESVRA